MTALETVTEAGAVLPDQLSQEEWEAFGMRLGNNRARLKWAIGDWVNYGRERWSDDVVTQAALRCGLAGQSLSNTMSVCKRVAPNVRRLELSFEHHDTVAALWQHPDRQARYLQVAVERRLSRDEFRAFVRDREADIVGLEGDVRIVSPLTAGGNGGQELPELDTEPDVEHILTQEPRVVHEPDPAGPIAIPYTLRVFCHPDDAAVVRDGLSRLGRGLVRWCAEHDVVVEVES